MYQTHWDSSKDTVVKCPVWNSKFFSYGVYDNFKGAIAVSYTVQKTNSLDHEKIWF